MPLLEKFIAGTCQYMCPLKEVQLREQEGLLHVLEMKHGTERHRWPKADYKKMVKSYSRSAAGQEVARAAELRPLATLHQTVQYLLRLAYAPPKNSTWLIVYEFVADRLRAVRQDMVIQGLLGQGALSMLEAMTLFHVYAGYRLCELKAEIFDPKLNLDLMLDCLKRCLALYDMEAESKNRALLEAIYALVSLGCSESRARISSLPHNARSQESTLALKLVLAVLNGNFVREFRLIRKMPAPLLCALNVHLPNLRRKALQTLSVAYSSKILTVPASKVAEWLSYPSVDACISECQHYGFSCSDETVHFQKSSFKEGERLSTCLRINYLDEELESCDIKSVFCAI